MTKRDLKFFVLGVTAMVLIIMTDGYRRLKQLYKTIDEVWSHASDGLQDMQESSASGESEERMVPYSPWTAELFNPRNDRKGNRAD